MARVYHGTTAEAWKFIRTHGFAQPMRMWSESGAGYTYFWSPHMILAKGLTSYARAATHIAQQKAALNGMFSAAATASNADHFVVIECDVDPQMACEDVTERGAIRVRCADAPRPRRVWRVDWNLFDAPLVILAHWEHPLLNLDAIDPRVREYVDRIVQASVDEQVGRLANITLHEHERMEVA